MRKISLGRKVLMGTVVMSVMAITGVAVSPSAFAKAHAVASASARYTVCSTGCPYQSVQAAITAAEYPGEIITIGPGHYAENVTVSAPVTLKGVGKRTVLYPAVSNPAPDGCEGSLCDGAASNIILIASSNVTIENMTLEGANPALAGSGVLVDGASINARNGIIDDYDLGDFNNLTVSNVNIQDIYLRGIEVTYDNDPGQTFTLTHNTVNNVQGDPSSIAIFNFGDSGVISNNTVTNAADAISANWSTGTQFLDNRISKSGSGIHTDNNGGSGGIADTIEGNSVSACTEDGYGIYVFVPYVSATVESNKVEGCYVGLAVFGSAVSGQGPTFSDNIVNGTGATTTDPDGTYGAYVTTDQLGYGPADVNASLIGNSFQSFTTGLFVTQTTPTNGDEAGGQATVTASPNNSFLRDTTGVNGDTGTVVNAADDWWGCRQGPNTSHCVSAIGTVQYTPWLTRRPPRS
jgi:hypothetical protein